ncbi:MAG: AAA family ATPase [Magnetococcales bacterium]|nr:AAA family ATPase [Magnetococcales bacterium]
MYLNHYKMHRFPFPNAADVEHFFEEGKRGVILKAIEYAVHNEEGLTTVVGEIGVGKSTMLRLLVKNISLTIDTVVVEDPRLSPLEFLKTIAQQLHISAKHTLQDLRIAITTHLYNTHLSQKRVVIIIDETQYISAKVLEEIHMLSNLEYNEKRMLQWVLFGQPQMEKQLDGKAASPLKDRIINRLTLEPLTLDEIESYIKFRVFIAGYKGPDIFNSGSIKLIQTISGGCLRKINLLAHKALMSAYARGSKSVQTFHVHLADQEHGKEHVIDVDFADTIEPNTVKKAKKQNRLWWNVAAIVVGIVTGTFSINYVSSGSNYFAMLAKENTTIEMNVEPVKKKKEVKHLVASFSFNPADMEN